MTQAARTSTTRLRFGIALRVGVYVFLVVLGLNVFPVILLPLGGYFAGSAMTAFASAAVANALVVRIFGVGPLPDGKGGDDDGSQAPPSPRARLHDIGLGWSAASVRNLLLGVGGGMLAALLVTVPGLLVGAAHFVPNPEAPLDFGSMFFVAVVLLFGAIGEELLFHGYGFQVLVRALGPFATILPTGFLFALAHSSNQNFGGFLGWPLLNTGLWGVVLGYAVVRAGDLWLPIGLHFGWNVVLPFFGVNLSGFKMGVTGYALKWTAGDLWSGGEYGPEASVLTTVVTILLIVYLAKAPVMRQTTALLGPPDDDPEAPADDLVQS